MDRIADAFERGRREGRPLLVAYLCAGDPDAETSLELCRALVAAGVDVLELGVPFSDPLADGLTNQLAAQRALASGMTQDKVFALVEALRRETSIPIVFYTYYNLVHARGPRAYALRAKEAGVDGVLTLDLPPEEADEFRAACAEAGLRTVFIIAPTTPASRLPKIADVTDGFLYYVSRLGVTGERKDLASDLAEGVARIRAATRLPLVVGFGISTPEQAAAVGKLADGVVVGSALVNVIPAHLGDRPAMIAALRAKAAGLKAALVG